MVKVNLCPGALTSHRPLPGGSTDLHVHTAPMRDPSHGLQSERAMGSPFVGRPAWQQPHGEH